MYEIIWACLEEMFGQLQKMKFSNNRAIVVVEVVEVVVVIAIVVVVAGQASRPLRQIDINMVCGVVFVLLHYDEIINNGFESPLL